MTRLRLSLLAAVVAFAAACGDNNPVTPIDEPTGDETLDVATFVGDEIAEAVSLLRTQEGAFGVPSADALFTGEWKSNCTYDATAAQFSCPVLSREGRTVVRGYQLFDAGGRPQSAYDAATTASATFSSEIIGTVTRDDFRASFTRKRTITVTGIAGNETQHTFNGTGTSTTARSVNIINGVERTYSITGTETIANVVVAFPRASGAWPLSGSITRKVGFAHDIASGKTHSGTLTATVTFNGGQTVDLLIGNRRFSLDLATGTVKQL